MIICAAILTGGNVVIRGQRHCDCLNAAERMRTPIDLIHSRTEGFINSEGKFLDRKEAMAEAVKCKQVPESEGFRDLFSEDIY